jgi:hypothetical protein
VLNYLPCFLPRNRIVGIDFFPATCRHIPRPTSHVPRPTSHVMSGPDKRISEGDRLFADLGEDLRVLEEVVLLKLGVSGADVDGDIRISRTGAVDRLWRSLSRLEDCALPDLSHGRVAGLRCISSGDPPIQSDRGAPRNPASRHSADGRETTFPQ